jgi:hypothetical protein
MILPSKERQIKGKTALRPPRKETGQPECTKGWQLERIARLSFFRLVHWILWRYKKYRPWPNF